MLLYGLVNAAPFLFGSILSIFGSDPLQHIVGRRVALFLAGLVSLVCVIGRNTHDKKWEYGLTVVTGSAYSRSTNELLAWRVFLGLG